MKISHRKQSFGQIAKRYHKYRQSYPKGTFTELFKLLQKRKGPIAVLDIGCGTGKSTESFLEQAPASLRSRLTLVGCDPDTKMLSEARAGARKNKMNISYVEGKAENLQFPQYSFDAIIAGSAFHWFATSKALKKINRALKLGGIFYVFWFEGRKKRPGRKKMISYEVLQKYGFNGIPSRARDDEKNQLLFKKSGFSDFNTVLKPFNFRRTVDEVIGSYTTGSAFIVMPKVKQKAFVRELKEAYAEALGKKNWFIARRQVHIHYGIKTR